MFRSLVLKRDLGWMRVDEDLFLSLLLSRVWGGLGFCSSLNFSSFIIEFEGATILIYYFISALTLLHTINDDQFT